MSTHVQESLGLPGSRSRVIYIEMKRRGGEDGRRSSVMISVVLTN